MNLDEMLRMQRNLDVHIMKEKNLNETGNEDWKTLALDVELSELANEWRGFKKWSNNQEPNVHCQRCFFEAPHKCENKLLEEYADGVSFFMSIAIEKHWTDSLVVPSYALLQRFNTKEWLTGSFIEIKYHLLCSYVEIGRDAWIERVHGITKQEFSFKNAWFAFIAIGIIGFGFTEEQIEKAYYDKNKINHERQDNGY